jgi:hypothetical protein
MSEQVKHRGSLEAAFLDTLPSSSPTGVADSPHHFITVASLNTPRLVSCRPMFYVPFNSSQNENTC